MSKGFKKIVIVGGGFGGIYTLKNLKKCLEETNCNLDITLISKENFFTFAPMLHEVATGGLDQNNIVEPIRQITGNKLEFVRDLVREINLKTKEVITKDNKFEYDYLVLATGAETNYFGNDNAKKYTMPLKSIEDSQNIKNKIIEIFEDLAKYKQRDSDGENNKVNLCVVGGGPTGIELVAELAELAKETILPNFPNVSQNDIEIHLITGGLVLAGFSDKSKDYAINYLKSLGIKVHSDLVADVTPNELIFSNGNKLEQNLTVWAAGVKANLPEINPKLDLEKGRIPVKNTLQLNGYDNVFALGDIANGWPMLAYTATRQAKIVSRNIISHIKNEELSKFDFVPKIRLISLGQRNGLGEIGNFVIKGRIVWFIWRTVYLSKIISSKKKVKIALNWTFNLFASRDISKI